MRAVLIVNPNATSTTAAGRDLLAHALESRVQLTVAHTDHRGHAIEFRINAEDPERNFAPAPGTIQTFHPPGGPGVRLDTHVYAGYKVPPHYDSLIAKLIVSAATRAETIVRARHVLDHFTIEGIPTTLPFLRRIVDDDAFVRGDVDTGFVERMMSEDQADA